jgi:hypothetical protein
MEKTVEEIKSLRHRYGLGLALIRKVCAYYDDEEDVHKALSDLSHSLIVMDADVFGSYLENHPEMKR